MTAEGWHPDLHVDIDARVEILQDELRACQGEIKRLRAIRRDLMRRILDFEPLGCGIYREMPVADRADLGAG